MNYSKSSLYFSPNLEEQALMELSGLLGIPLKTELGRYLGHQLVYKGRYSSQQGDVMERVRRKLAGWKSTYLLRVGRLTLAKSVLSNLVVFNMQAQKLTARTNKVLDRTVRQFVWGSSPIKKKIHLISWDLL